MLSKTLFELCKGTIIEKFTGEQLFQLSNSLNSEQRNLLPTVLPLDLPLHLSLSLELNEEYWKKKCSLESWSNVEFWLNECSWRRTFISHFAEKLIDDFIAQQIPFSEVVVALSKISQFLHTLNIRGYKLNYANNNPEDVNSSELRTSLEKNILTLVKMFSNLEVVYFYNFPINLDLFKEKNDGSEIYDCDLLCETISTLESMKKLSIIGGPTKYINYSMFITNLTHMSLVDVNFSCSQIGDDLCEPISKLIAQTELQSLQLSNNYITGKGAQECASVLMGNKSLRVLKLDRNLIASDGAISIVQSVTSNKYLLELDLSCNKMDKECSDAVCGFLKENNTLQCLNIAGNNLGKESGKLLRDSIQASNSILVLGCQFCGFDEETEDFIYSHVLKNFQTHNKK